MTEALINVENLSATFNDRAILSQVSFSAFSGQVTIILGRSGCGKTTVLKHLIGLYPVQRGRITIARQNLGTLSESEQRVLALQMGVLFQNGALLNSLTVAENVAIPLQQHTDLPDDLVEELVRLKLQLVELSEAGHLYPAQISGGMRKRAALARALALDPEILFFDEPSAGLDPVTLASLDELILKLKAQLGMTIVLITHELGSIHRLSDRVVFMDEGRVLFEGTLPEAKRAGVAEIDRFFART